MQSVAAAGCRCAWRNEGGLYDVSAGGREGLHQIYNPDLPLGFPKSSGTISSKFAKSSLLAYPCGDRTLSVGLGPTGVRPKARGRVGGCVVAPFDQVSRVQNSLI